ncbi:MAG: ribosome recycling factor [Candidatus Magnetoovum sp. WYHC-5]|nr:ribosome recycling factor [Candidatus Magnetoovum sp. WYHC-5]
MDKEFKKKLTYNMDLAIERLKKDITSIRTGRASLSILDGVHIDYYGKPTPINQVAVLSVPDSQTITIAPWENRLISDIEKAILKSDLGLNPSNDGKAVRLSIPPLTEERRKQLVKVLKKKGEESKVDVRNIRRDFNEQIKNIEKEGHISQDETKRGQAEIQKITDSYIKMVDDVLSHKEKEIMEV